MGAVCAGAPHLGALGRVEVPSVLVAPFDGLLPTTYSCWPMGAMARLLCLPT